MKAFVAILALVGLAHARITGLSAVDFDTFQDTPCGGDIACNSKVDSRNKCEADGTCTCAKGFAGKYCTCEGICTTPFGSCNDDAAGTCTCTPDWKGRNCNCPNTCPDNAAWKCLTGDTIEERGCVCRVDNQFWTPTKKCCPRQCTGLMYCPNLQDGICYCPTSNTYIPYGSPDSSYKCCEAWCERESLCQCRPDGCYVKLTGVKATKESDCKTPSPGSCTTPNSWQECSIVHWQGRCQCDPLKGCRCKCWYGWAGGNGNYELPGWDPTYKALYSDHCRNRCDWTHDYQPSHCSTCNEVTCPECSPPGAKKCAGTA